MRWVSTASASRPKDCAVAVSTVPATGLSAALAAEAGSTTADRAAVSAAPTADLKVVDFTCNFPSTPPDRTGRGHRIIT
ncbi:hypothetical protein GCM10009579_13720 [Streptomyces javensis]|uniref:Uncharacterized protein n=1 Tax=Streptomyces javensis TaxID=114698 RepID=A0ABN1WNQ3_9ACTN